MNVQAEKFKQLLNQIVNIFEIPEPTPAGIYQAGPARRYLHGNFRLKK